VRRDIGIIILCAIYIIITSVYDFTPSSAYILYVSRKIAKAAMCVPFDKAEQVNDIFSTKGLQDKT